MPLQPTDLRDYRMQVRNAIHNLRLVEQVLLSGRSLFERQLDPPEKSAQPAAPESVQAKAPVEDETAEMLMRLAVLPPTARLTTAQAASYLNCSESLLRSWRWNGRGPPFEGRGRLVRYVKANLDRFMTD